jgi:hypothetical protein
VFGTGANTPPSPVPALQFMKVLKEVSFSPPLWREGVVGCAEKLPILISAG